MNPTSLLTASPTSTSSTDANAAGWAFVLQHARMIDRLCAKLCTDPRIDKDDLRQEASLWIARGHHGYDPSRAEPVTWIWWRVRRARQALLEQRNRRDRHEVLSSTDPMLGGGYANLHHDRGTDARTTERRILVGQVLAHATLEEAQACCTILADLDGPEAQPILGISSAGRGKRIRNLAAALSVPAAMGAAP